jgi:hypothetical protein
MAGEQNKISFSEYEMEHLYDMARDNMEDECIECQKLKYRIEKFLKIVPKAKKKKRFRIITFNHWKYLGRGEIFNTLSLLGIQIERVNFDKESDIEISFQLLGFELIISIWSA